MGRRVEDVDTFIEEAIDNIRNDRAVTSNLLTKLMIEIQQANDKESHKELGLIASKYVETLQRSNEQLVKLTAILNKNKPASDQLNDEDRNQIFDILQSNGTS